VRGVSLGGGDHWNTRLRHGSCIDYDCLCRVGLRASSLYSKLLACNLELRRPTSQVCRTARMIIMIGTKLDCARLFIARYRIWFIWSINVGWDRAGI